VSAPRAAQGLTRSSARRLSDDDARIASISVRQYAEIVLAGMRAD
jgi:hypothetical protein